MIQETSPSPHKHGSSKCTSVESVESATCLKKKLSIEIDNSHLQLAGKHFVRKFTTVPGSKRKMPARKCSV